jgi:hypothetical protein
MEECDYAYAFIASQDRKRLLMTIRNEFDSTGATPLHRNLFPFLRVLLRDLISKETIFVPLVPY